jgi:chloramphenicol 3-O phosphotransferase
MDHFIEMAPPSLMGTDEGLRFLPENADGGPSVAIETGPAFERLLAGMRRAIAAMADEGNDLVVDDVLWNSEEAAYRRLLAAHDLRLVALVAPLAVIEEREKARGDRMPGLARWQHPRMHRGVGYDLEIDMSAASPAEAAALIRDAFAL